MERLSIFYPAKNDAGYVQAVIVGDDLPVYQALGFVTSVDDLQPIAEDKADDDKQSGGDDKSKADADSDNKTTGNKSTKTKAGADGSDSDKG